MNVLYVRPNSYNLVINLSTSKHANYGVDFSYDFKSDISYAIKIVSNVNMLSVYVDGIRVNHVDVGDVRSFGLVKLFLSDRWLPAPNALIKNFNFQNGVEDCITIYSECDYKGVEHEVCGDNPDLRASGFDYVVKSV